MVKRLLVLPVVAVGLGIVTLATLGFCGDRCGLIGNFLMLQHYFLHSQALALSYSAVGLVGLASFLLPYVSERGLERIFGDDEALTYLFSILKEDERRVITTITDAGGRLTQREISRRADLSRLKTHRVVMRLKERGLVTAERHGRMSEVSLAPWLTSQMKDN